MTPGPLVTAPKSLEERLNSSIAERIKEHYDSMVVAAQGNKPPDWTVTKGGKKYGIDQRNIYIGDVKIPTALLALLPLNQQANPIIMQRERALAWQHDDIVFQGQKAMSEDELSAAIKRIRDGTYGICEVTQKPIAKERLLAVPFTRYSAEAQKNIERNRHHSRSQAGLLGELGEEGGKMRDDDGGGDD